MTINAYNKGDLVRVSAAFTNFVGKPIDPGVVICEYRNPARLRTALTYGTNAALVKDSVGNYHVDIDANVRGMWYVRWYSTGTGQTAAERQFLALESAL